MNEGETTIFTDKKLEDFSLYKPCIEAIELTFSFEGNMKITMLLSEEEKEKMIQTLNLA